MTRNPDTHDHATHDLEPIAAFAAGDATGSDLEMATSLVAACAGCAALHHDLRAITAALPDLPAPVRRRDFRLTEDQAAALRTNRWRRLMGALAGPRFSFASPLGTGLATIGIAVLVLSGSLGVPFATGGAATAERAVSGQQFSAQSPVPSAAAALDGAGAPASQPAPQAAATGAPAAATAAPEAPTTTSDTDTAAGDGTDTGNAADADGQAEGAPTSGGKSATAGDFSAQSGIDGRDLGLAVGVAAFLTGLALLALRQLVRRLA